MEDKKIKHLEFIQNTITRMSTNSFIIKGWSITLTSALFALAAKETNKDYILLTYFSIPLFWYLNGFFLSQERKFRSLYDMVRMKNEDLIDFSMDTKSSESDKNSLINSIFSKSIWPFYFFMMIISWLIMFYLR